MKCESKRFVGFWHYGVVLTYLSVVSAVIGICFSIGGNKRSLPEVGVICLLLSGFCDGFDGAVAKTFLLKADCTPFSPSPSEEEGYFPKIAANTPCLIRKISAKRCSAKLVR